MILHRLTADFGKLQGDTLHFHEGLNVIEAPNESGKSTWCAFLRCMLYGVNTSEREKAGVKPDKVLFTPWNGSPMSGVMDLEFAGREYTLQRQTIHPNAPMGVYNAYYAGTARTAPELMRADVGEILTGVSESVFERTAFIGNAAMGVTNGTELEKRIASMVSSGEENISFSEASTQLQSLQRSLRFRNRGRLPEIEIEARNIKNALSFISDAAAELETNEAETEHLYAKLESLRKATDSDITSRWIEISSERNYCNERIREHQAEQQKLSEQIEAARGSFLPRLLGALLLAFAAIVLSVFWMPLFTWALPAVVVLFLGAFFFGIWCVRGAAVERLRQSLREEVEDNKERVAELQIRLERLEKEEDALAEKRTARQEKVDFAEMEYRKARETAITVRGRLSTMEDKTILETRLRTLTAEHKSLEKRYAALGIALDELSAADEEMQNVFSPAISTEAGALFARLTGERYEEVFFSRQLRALARRSGETVSHEDAFLSRGTEDQLYLALRLALCNMLLPSQEACPIILDDALINFDDERMGYALDVLMEIAKQRQVILFTCHSREKSYVQKKMADRS